jgi:hypothetical protein
MVVISPSVTLTNQWCLTVTPTAPTNLVRLIDLSNQAFFPWSGTGTNVFNNLGQINPNYMATNAPFSNAVLMATGTNSSAWVSTNNWSFGSGGGGGSFSVTNRFYFNANGVTVWTNTVSRLLVWTLSGGGGGGGGGVSWGDSQTAGGGTSVTSSGFSVGASFGGAGTFGTGGAGGAGGNTSYSGCTLIYSVAGTAGANSYNGNNGPSGAGGSCFANGGNGGGGLATQNGPSGGGGGGGGFIIVSYYSTAGEIFTVTSGAGGSPNGMQGAVQIEW